jgi:inorganic pyrophosphatase
VLRVLDRGEPDERIVAVPTEDSCQNECFDIAALPRRLLREIEQVFRIDKDLDARGCT